MQFQASVPHGWRELSWYALVIFLASVVSGSFFVGLVAVISLWLSRKKPAAEIHLSEAQAELAIAQTDEARMRIRKTKTEIDYEIHLRLGQLSLELSQLEEQLRHKDDQIRMLEDQIEMYKKGRTFGRTESAG